MKASVCGLVAAVLICGCAVTPPPDPNVATLTVYSEPQGAMISSAGKSFGMAPRSAPFQITPKHRADGLIKVAPVTATWPSGATVTMNLTMSLSKGNKHQYVFRRPVNAPGLDKDLAHAAQIEQNALMRQQARQAEERENSRAFAELMSGVALSAGERRNDDFPALLPQPSSSSNSNLMMKIEPQKSYDCRGTGPNRATCTQQ